MSNAPKCPQCGGTECGVGEVETKANHRPENDNGQLADNKPPVKTHSEQKPDCIQTATIIALLKLRGHHATRTAIGGFNVSFQGLMRHCIDSESLKAFATKVGAIHHE